MKQDLNKGGRWPAVTRVDFIHRKRMLPLSPYDLSEGMPKRADSIPFRWLISVIVGTGLVIGVGGVLVTGYDVTTLVYSWLGCVGAALQLATDKG